MHLSQILESIDLGTRARYDFYLRLITPTNPEDVLRRWLFAFMSIHTTWTSNVRGYRALQDLRWLEHPNRETRLVRLIRDAGVGLHNGRAHAIDRFATAFSASPSRFSFTGNVKAERDALAKELYGIGFAKVSFAAELINPSANIACLDVHTLRWLGAENLNGTQRPEVYRRYEKRWIRRAKSVGLPPVTARHIVWDRMKGKPDMRYWSWILES